MLPLLFAAAVGASQPPAPGLASVGGLAGCWTVKGQVRGKDASSIARGEWHLGQRYFILHLRQTTTQPYEAAITYGAGEKPDAIGSFWMDTFGGLYEPSLGLGRTSPGGFTLSYRFPDALYVNRFERQRDGWHWSIAEQAPDRPDKLFADYTLIRASCRGMRFGF
jgi:hypothetical protein